MSHEKISAPLDLTDLLEKSGRSYNKDQEAFKL